MTQKDQYEQEAAAILAKQKSVLEVIPHPMHLKVEELGKTIESLQQTVEQEAYMDYICDEVMGLKGKLYRRKIKGFHLAFNVRDKLSGELSSYKYQPKGTAEEVRLKALRLRT